MTRAWQWFREAGAPLLLVILALSMMNGCNLNPVKVHEPTTARPEPERPAIAARASGAIFNENASYRPLFEDRRARYIGDTLVIQLNEKLQASRNASSNASRKGDTAFGVPTLTNGLPGKGYQGTGVAANSSNTFEGKGAAAADNLFTGTITVTVIEVLPNGNLIVSGEKQIGIAENSETLRFSGVVAPYTILAGNTVTSTQVADARIDYRGSGYIDEAQAMGFLARFFLTILPF
ncbi:MAG: flagellar basal body L-ring protein FlgH [Betaproteobacteria bacterium]|nr:flagellar basal body L-ring protein FlgH [Betaproteobacteria bacterium]